MINDAFGAFWSGMAGGLVIGIMIFSVVVAIKTDEEHVQLERINDEKEEDNV